MKTISILIPTYNEEENVPLLYPELKALFVQQLANYKYEFVFIDNKSKDKTREEILKICNSDKNVKAIFNCRNFGQFNSPYYGITQTTGDCCILLCADFQDPLEMIPQFVAEWEKGFRIVVGIKNKSKENPLMFLARSIFYRALKKMSEVEMIEHFTGFGLYDKSFVDVLKNLDDSTPFLRGIVAELGFERKEISYTQAKRRAGKTSNNWFKLYDAAMLGITSYTKSMMRLATFVGFFLAGISIVVALVYLVLKLLFWDHFPTGIAPITIAIFFFGSIQLFFIGFLGEYILSINARVKHRPLVVEDQRINYQEKARLL